MTDDTRAHVLVVEDEEDLASLVEVNLELAGHRVTVARDGGEGLERARELRPDLVLLDVMMPKMDGWQVLTALKADPAVADIPVVMLTAKVQDQDQIRGWSAGAAEYITKPFSPLSLSQVLKDVLANSPDEEAARRQRILDKLRLMSDS